MHWLGNFKGAVTHNSLIFIRYYKSTHNFFPFTFNTSFFNAWLMSFPMVYTVEPPNKGHFGTSYLILYSSSRRLLLWGKGSRSVSFVGRLSLSRRVHYRRFHCISLTWGKADTMTHLRCTPYFSNELKFSYPDLGGSLSSSHKESVGQAERHGQVEVDEVVHLQEKIFPARGTKWLGWIPKCGHFFGT